MAGQNHNEESQNEITNNGIEPVSQNEDEINSEGRHHHHHHRWSLSVLIHHLLTLGKSYFEVGTKFIYIFQRMTC